MAAASLAQDASRPEAEPTATRRVGVEEGGQRVLQASGVTRISVGDPSVADVKLVDGDELLITGVKAGRTTLILWYGELRETHFIEVGSNARLQEVFDLLEMLDLRHLRAKQVGEKIVLDGTISDIEEYDALERLERVSPGLVYLVRIDPAVFTFIGHRIEAALGEAGMPDAHATVIGHTIFLEGTVSDERERQKAEKIARAIYRSAVVP